MTSRPVSSPLSAVKAADAARLEPPSRLAVSSAASRYSRFVHQLSDFPHIQHLRAELRARRFDTASPPVSLRPHRQRWPPVIRQTIPATSYSSMSYGSTAAAAVNRPAPVATETSFSAYVTEASRCAHSSRTRGLNQSQTLKAK